jgi:hypothetical protein
LVDLRYQQPILCSRAQKAHDPNRRDSNKRKVFSQTRNATLLNPSILTFLKIVKIIETFTFGFCTLWVTFSAGEGLVDRLEDGVEKEDWMKRAIFLATAALLVMLILAPVALAQETTPMGGETTPMEETTPGALAPSGGPAILLPAAALLLGSGVLTYAILRRR